MMQFVAVGLLLGQVCLTFVDRSGRISTIAEVAAIIAVIVLSKAKLLVRKSVRRGIVGVAVGILLVSFVVVIAAVLAS